jgi:serine/threonine protein kinase
VAVPSANRSTRDKSVTGTIRYAPPEQLGELPGVEVGAHSDVYSFGKTALDALFGTTAPKSWDWEELPTEARAPLQKLLERCTADSLKHRYANFEPVLRAFDELNPTARVSAPPHPKVEEREPPVAGAPEPPAFPDDREPVTFTRWRYTPKEIKGATRQRVQLVRQPDTTDIDWTLLHPLRFWLIEQGENTRTFGFLLAELPDLYRAPFERWVDSARGRHSGVGWMERRSLDGTVIRINLGVAATRILAETEGWLDDLILAELTDEDPDPLPEPPPPPLRPPPRIETHAERLARFKREAAEKNDRARALVAKYDYAGAVEVLNSFTPEQQRHRDNELFRTATERRDRLVALDASIKPLLDHEEYHHPRLPALLAEFVALCPTHPEYGPLARELPSEEPPANPKEGEVLTLRAWIDAPEHAPGEVMTLKATIPAPEHAPGEIMALRWKALAKRPNPNG